MMEVCIMDISIFIFHMNLEVVAHHISRKYMDCSTYILQIWTLLLLDQDGQSSKNLKLIYRKILNLRLKKILKNQMPKANLFQCKSSHRSFLLKKNILLPETLKKTSSMNFKKTEFLNYKNKLTRWRSKWKLKKQNMIK